jgi:hypothetical protein
MHHFMKERQAFLGQALDYRNGVQCEFQEMLTWVFSHLSVYQGVEHETLRLDTSAQGHVAAYLEYERIVGSADNGVMLSEAQYEAFKRKAKEMRKDRLYVTWRCELSGIDCKSVGPASKCFCRHMYKQHSTDNMTGEQAHKKDVHCKVPGCKCNQFEYIPGHGTWSIKCVKALSL